MRTAVAGSVRRPEKTKAPTDFISSSRTWISSQDRCISSSLIAGPTSPSTLCTDNRYCAMVVLLVMGGPFPLLTPTTNGPRPDRQVYTRNMHGSIGVHAFINDE